MYLNFIFYLFLLISVVYCDEKFNNYTNNDKISPLGRKCFGHLNADGFPLFLPPQQSRRMDGSAIFEWHGGVVPYYIDPEYYDKVVSTRIMYAAHLIEQISCIKFIKLSERPPRTCKHAWLQISNPQGEKDCVHQVRVGREGQAVMVFGYECMHNRDITHALFHVLGFHDEVTHPQRDTYVRIIWENIQPQYHKLFKLRKNNTLPSVQYDPFSIMHFHDTAYSANGGATILPKIPGLEILPSDKFSQLDIMKLRAAFGHQCHKRRVGNLLETCKTILMSEENNQSSGNKSPKVLNDDNKYMTSVDCEPYADEERDVELAELGNVSDNEVKSNSNETNSVQSDEDLSITIEDGRVKLKGIH